MEKKFIDFELTPENILNLLGVKNCGDITGVLLSSLLKRKAIVSSVSTTYAIKATWYDAQHKILDLYSGVKGMVDANISFDEKRLNEEGWIISVKEELSFRQKYPRTLSCSVPTTKP